MTTTFEPRQPGALEKPGVPETARVTRILSILGPYLGLLFVIALFSFLLWLRDPQELRYLKPFLSMDNLKLITVHASVVAAVAIGMTLIMISGGIDLSVGYVVSLVTVVTVLAYRWAYDHGLEDWASLCAILAGIGTGVLAGLGNGLLITQLRVAPFVVTLGMMGAARGVARYLSGGTPVAFPNHQPPAWVPWLGAIEPNPPWLGIGPGAWTVIALALAAAILLRFTVLGRYIYALGSNEATARLCGIAVERTKIVIYLLAGLITGWAGVLQTTRTNGLGIYDVKAGMELDVIAAVVIGGGSLAGGEGTIMGTIVGALLLQVLDNGFYMLKQPLEFRFILIGAIIVGVAALNSWRQRRLH